MEGLFNQRLPPIVNPVERCIYSSHLWLVRKYIAKLSAYLENPDIVQKVKQVQHY